MADRSGIDFEPQIISSVRVAFNDSDIETLRTTDDIFSNADADFTTEWLDAAQLRELEPRISQDAIRALDARGNATLSSQRFTQALAASAETMGAKILLAEATGIATDGANVTAVQTTAGDLPCAAAVFATGPWAAQVGDWLSVPVPIEPFKGEILRTTLPSGPLPADFEDVGGVSLNSRERGQVWIGATEENLGFDLEPSDSARETLLNGAKRLMPATADAQIVKHTACLRPLSPDWMPILGRAPGWNNAYLATGAGKKGILLSPAIGKTIADLITDGKTDLPVSGFAPDRFA